MEYYNPVAYINYRNPRPKNMKYRAENSNPAPKPDTYAASGKAENKPVESGANVTGNPEEVPSANQAAA